MTARTSLTAGMPTQSLLRMAALTPEGRAELHRQLDTMLEHHSGLATERASIEASLDIVDGRAVLLAAAAPDARAQRIAKTIKVSGDQARTDLAKLSAALAEYDEIIELYRRALGEKGACATSIPG